MRTTQIFAFIDRELKSLLSDKMTLFWVVAWPLFWIFMVAYVFVPPSGVTPIKLMVGVVNYDVNATGNFTASNLIDIMSNVTYGGEKIFSIKSYDARDSLIRDLKHGKVDVGLIIPEGFSRNLTLGIARLEVLIGARDPRIASINYGFIRGFLEEFSKRIGIVRANMTLRYMYSYIPEDATIFQDPELRRYLEEFMLGIASPINASYTEVRPEILTTRESILGWYVIGAIGMTFLYSGFASGAVLILKEKEAGTLRRILASPISPAILVTALILSDVVLFVVSSVILIIVGIYGVGARIIFNPFNITHWLVPLIILAGAVMCEGIGIILSLLARTVRGASGLGTTLGLFLAFITGVWFPKEMMPGTIRVLSDYSPPTWVFETLRKIMVFDTPIHDLIVDLEKIAIGLAVTLLADVIIYRVKLQKYMTTY